MDLAGTHLTSAFVVSMRCDNSVRVLTSFQRAFGWNPAAFVACRGVFVACSALTKTLALRGYRPGLGPAAEILSLRRQSKYSKKGDPGVAAPSGYPFMQYKKWEMPETRSPCRAHNRLQAIAVSQAKCMHFETPATPQTRAFLDPFSVLHKRRLHMGTAESQKQPQRQTQQQQQQQRACSLTLFPHKHIHPVTPKPDKVKIAASSPTLHSQPS
ncbi:hypothetical protein DFR42_10563 [Undibacterium pigrum]|uniref:Uncharacterized protein n=1 Tax=Undibacterium pigrum TaxID=401470 RepID=A0A318J1L2_9BURK|nr:hypothetical protein DFR42_10563 [Undibacterium pigrum]